MLKNMILVSILYFQIYLHALVFPYNLWKLNIGQKKIIYIYIHTHIYIYTHTHYLCRVYIYIYPTHICVCVYILHIYVCIYIYIKIYLKEIWVWKEEAKYQIIKVRRFWWKTAKMSGRKITALPLPCAALRRLLPDFLQKLAATAKTLVSSQNPVQTHQWPLGIGCPIPLRKSADCGLQFRGIGTSQSHCTAQFKIQDYKRSKEESKKATHVKHRNIESYSKYWLRYANTYVHICEDRLQMEMVNNGQQWSIW